MQEIKFDSEETRDYFEQARRKYHMGIPSNWSSDMTITKEDVDGYILDAENVLDC